MGFGGSLFGSRSLLNTEPQMNAAQKSDFNNLRPYLPAARTGNPFMGGIRNGTALTDQQKLYQDERTYLSMSRDQHNQATNQFLTTSLANVAQQMKDNSAQFQTTFNGLNAQSQQQATQQAAQLEAAKSNAAQNQNLAATRPQANSGGSTTTQPSGSSGGGPGGGTLLTGGNGINAQQYQLGKASLLGN